MTDIYISNISLFQNSPWEERTLCQESLEITPIPFASLPPAPWRTLPSIFLWDFVLLPPEFILYMHISHTIAQKRKHFFGGKCLENVFHVPYIEMEKRFNLKPTNESVMNRHNHFLLTLEILLECFIYLAVYLLLWNFVFMLFITKELNLIMFI